MLTHPKAFELHKKKTGEESIISRDDKWKTGVEDAKHQKYKEVYR